MVVHLADLMGLWKAVRKDRCWVGLSDTYWGLPLVDKKEEQWVDQRVGLMG